MIHGEQVVTIDAAAISFTIVCECCADLDAAEGSAGSTFAGRLDADLDAGTFLCRRGHSVRIERTAPPAAATEAA
jgi:hypothetical protein